MKAPPFSTFLGIELESRGEGQARCALELAPHHLNRRGVAHGGILASLLDSALGAAVISSMPEAWWCATTSLSIQFIAGVGPGRLVATGRVLRRGRTTAFATGEVHDAAGNVVAAASGTWHLWSAQPGEVRRPTEQPWGCVVLRATGEPVAVGKIVAVGRNYADHVAEMGGSSATPPVLFLKPTSALVGDGARIELPRDHGAVHHEVELVALIGRRGRAIAPADALDHVAGFAVGLDLTLRDLQAGAKSRGEPWSEAKGFDGSAPVSAVAPRAEVGDGSGLEITLAVNGEIRQQGNTSQMLRPVPDLVASCSRLMTLEPGDLIFTGTPAGVGPVAPGDVLEASVSRVGTLRVTLS